jgi:hypothetical protein
LSGSSFLGLSKECGSPISGLFPRSQGGGEIESFDCLISDELIGFIEETLGEVSLSHGGIVVVILVHFCFVFFNHLCLPFDLGIAGLDKHVDCSNLILNNFDLGISIVLLH